MAIEKKIKISVDYQEAINAFNNITEAEKKVGKTAEDVSKQIKTAFKPTEARNFNQETTRTRGIIEKLENQLKQFRLDKKEALTTSDIEKFNNKISETQRKLQDLNNKGLKEVNKTTSSGVGIFKNLLGTITAVFAVERVLAFAKASFVAYQEQIKAERVLLAALNNRESSYKRLVKQATDLQKRAAIDDETIMSIQTFYAQQGLTEKQIIKTTEAAVRLSKVTGQDLQTVMLQLAGTYEGTLGRLGKLDSKFRALTKTQLENGAAIDLVLQKYSTNVMEKTVTDVDRLNIAWREFQEEFGKDIAPAIIPVLQAAIPMFKSLVPVFTLLTPLLQAMVLPLQLIAPIIKSTADMLAKIPVDWMAKVFGSTDVVEKQLTDFSSTLEDFNNKVAESVDEIRNNASELLASKKFTSETKALQFSLDQFLEKSKKDIKQWYEYSAGMLPLVFKTAEQAITESVNNIIASSQEVKEIGFKPLEEEISKLNVQLQQAIINGNVKLEEQLAKLINNKTLQLKIYQNLFDFLAKPISPKSIESIKASSYLMDEFEKITGLTVKQWEELSVAIQHGTQIPLLNQLPKTIDKYKDSLTKAKAELDKWVETQGNEDFFQKLFGFGGETGDTQEQLDDKKKSFESLKEAYKEVANQIMNNIKDIAQAEVDAANRQVETLNRLYQEKQTALSNDIALNKAGFASNVELRQKELAQTEIDRQKALAAQKKALKQQQILETASQMFSLVTATANIIKEWTKLGPLGIIGAVGSIATMFATFVKARIDATKATKFAKGGLLEGKSHARGGIYIPELNSEVEGGEYVTNKKSTRKYFPLIEALNKDNPRMIEIALDKQLGRNLERKQNIINRIEVKGGDEEARTLRNIEKLLSRNEVFYGNGFKIERIGNVVRKINV